MSESHAGTSREIFSAVFKSTQKIENPYNHAATDSGMIDFGETSVV